MTTIQEYLKQMRKHVLELKGDESVVEEYESHLSAEFTYFQIKNPTLKGIAAEKEFIQQLESPEVIARSFILEDSEKIPISKSRDNFLIRLGQSRFVEKILFKPASKISKFYQEHNNPLLTAFLCYTFFLTNISFLVFIYYNLLDKGVLKEDFSIIEAFFSIFASIPIFPWIFLKHSFSWIFLVIPFLILFVLGWKQSAKDVVLVALFLGLFSIAFNTLLSTQQRLSIFTAPRWATGYTTDWIFISIPSFFEYIISAFDLLFVKQFLGVIVFVFISGMVGVVVKYLIENGLKPTIRRIDKPTALKSGTIIICLIFLMIPIINYQRYPRYYLLSAINTQPPTPNMTPLFYYFSVYSQNNRAPDFTKKIAEFGDLSFNDGPCIFQVSFNTSNLTEIEPTMSCTMSPIHSDGIKSDFSFPMLGILYLPAKYRSQTWLDIIKHNFSSISPMKGFNAEADTKTISIEWIINDYFVKLSVNTLLYSSTTNNSVYTFHFEKKTGWLMEATLIRDGTWSNEGKYEILTLQRLFRREAFESQEEQHKVINQYKMMDFILTIPIFLISSSILVRAILFYHKKRDIKE